MQKRGTPRPERRYRGRPRPVSDQPRGTLEDVRRIIGVDSAPTVAKVLPEALAQASEERGPALAAALEPTVTRTIRDVASRESHWFGELLAPTIGTAVRKAVTDSIAALVQRFNETLERALSVRSVQWRLEALRTGRPFAEVVMLRTLVYRVEQVFLIHSESGLVLQHVAAEDLPAADPDQVASMLTAIDTFGREAFEPTQTGAYLHEFAMGDVRVWIDRGPMIAMALVVRGVAPRTLLRSMVETREKISLEWHADLKSFVVDTKPFTVTRPLLEQCLLEQRTKPPQRGWLLALLTAGVLAAIAAVLVHGHVRALAGERQLANYREAIEAEPGVVVTSAARQHGRYRLRGFRDPLAATPAELTARLGHPALDLSLQPFYSLEPQIIAQRFRRVTGAPAGVEIRVVGGTLELSGEAPQAWLTRALALAPTTPGIERVDNRVTDTTAGELAAVTQALAVAEVRFAPGSSALSPRSDPLIEEAARLIDRVRLLSSELGLERCVIVVGDADPIGAAGRNTVLAAERATAVLAALREKAPRLTSDMVRVRGRSVSEVGGHTRSARFEVQSGPVCGKGAGQ
ncbi:MAG TPA: OmpA family protein [Polyangiaceae bacterium]|nr:OmpA family protein [Polyangiaceae bacterium]